MIKLFFINNQKLLQKSFVLEMQAFSLTATISL